MNKKIERGLFLIACLVVIGVATYAANRHFLHEEGDDIRQPAALAHGQIPDFTLIDHAGEIHRLYTYGDARYVVITAHGNGCPIIQKFTIKLNEMRSKYKDKSVQFLMLNANTEDDRASVMQEASDYGVQLPILLDPSQVIAKTLGFTRTSETVVIDVKSWKIVYRGPINDQLDYGVDKQKARNEYLEDALDNLLAGEKIKNEPPQAKGCLISYREAKEISFKKDIMPILEAKCLRCHFPPTRFPPALKSIASLHSWSAMIRETVVTERMPPFSADPLYGPYANDLSLTAQEKFLLVEWLDRGAPKDAGGGDPLVDYQKPLAKKYEKIANSKPLMVVKMDNPAVIPPRGEVEYKYFPLGGPIPEDMWISSINMISTNPRQLHHVSLMVTPQPLEYYEKEAKAYRDESAIARNTDGDIPIYTLWKMNELNRATDPHFNRLQVWAAGRSQPSDFGDNAALFLPKGYHLTLESHYMGTGREETEQTTLEFYGSRQQNGKSRVRTLLLSNTEFEIPPNARKHLVVTKPYKITHDMEIRALLAHMHMRGRAIRALLKPPGGELRTVASIPNFYYGWQTGAGVMPKTPIPVPAGSELSAICEFDNSAQNPNNPDPNRLVRFGQTHDRTEMCHLNLQTVVSN